MLERSAEHHLVSAVSWRKKNKTSGDVKLLQIFHRSFDPRKSICAVHRWKHDREAGRSTDALLPENEEGEENFNHIVNV